MRSPEGYAGDGSPPRTALDWSEWGGFGQAVEMCNNNGTCRKTLAALMCPSYRATRDEQHVTRGRANSLRLAITASSGPRLHQPRAMKETLDLCVSCKACRANARRASTWPRMKIEFLHHYHARHGLPARERLIAHLPRYAPMAARLAPLLNLRDRIGPVARATESWLGFSARRTLPRWRRPWKPSGPAARPEEVRGDGLDLVLFADTFNRTFERENLQATERVLAAAGYRLHRVEPEGGGRPLCCGRTYLSAGLVDEARREARRTLDALAPYVARGARVVGLEPSCLLTFRDEFAALLPKNEVEPLAAASLLMAEALAADLERGRVTLPLADQGGRTAHVHGHCHQKAFGAMGAVETVLASVPGLSVRMIESSCCGMSGAFGYGAATIDVSFAMAELSLLPAVRAAGADDIVVADGTSCRHQIHDGAGREAVHMARVLADALAPSGAAGEG
jgi:Fe-S oxidoreductase